jgi:hypothetical protein
MKLGRVEGTPEEIRDIFQNNGLKLEEYLEKPESPMAVRWLVIPAIMCACALLLLILLPSVSITVTILLFVIGAAGAVWLTAGVQIRFKNSVATFVVALGVLLLLLVASGFIAPRETADLIKGIKGK